MGKVVKVADDRGRSGSLGWPDKPLSDGVVTLDRMGAMDIPTIVSACNDPKITRWLGLPSPYTQQHAGQFLDQQVVEAERGDLLNFAIRLAPTGGKLVGSIGANFARARPGECEVGYWVARPARGRGLARRAIVLLAGYLFSTCALRRIELLIEPDNLASRRAAQGAGAHFEGVRRAGMRRGDGEVSDVAIYAFVPADLLRPPA
jgi:RimJ/RimL family protein N-acetyltransferase